MIRAPFTPAQVQILNERQCQIETAVAMFHPFTCQDRSTSVHGEHGGDRGLLIATTQGWMCPYCGHTQDWAHKAMVIPTAGGLLDEIWPLEQWEDDLRARIAKRAAEYKALYQAQSFGAGLSGDEADVAPRKRDAIAVMLASLNRRLIRLYGLMPYPAAELTSQIPGWISVKEGRPPIGREVDVLMRVEAVRNPLHSGYGVDAWVVRSSVANDSRAFWCELVESGSASHWREVPDSTVSEGSEAGATHE